MDCSPEYIKMCDCLEIQKQRVKGYNSEYGFWDTEIYLGDFYAELLHEKWNTDWYDNDCGIDKQATQVIWLPRQDQLQAMLIKHLDIQIDELHLFIYDFYLFIDCDCIQRVGDYRLREFTSMEQLWLAFYMKEKHNRVWTGSEWN